MSDGQGSTGSVLAAICNFLIPGLGQLVHLWSIPDAALYRPAR